MIKFFRKIRQKLLTESNFKKYLLYATGEIVLVVIGILIALQVNNINSSNKLKNSTSKHISIFIKDLNEENITLDSLHSLTDNQLKRADNVLDYFKLKTPKDIELLGDITSLVIEYNFKSNSSGYEILSNTDEISLLSDELQTMISGYINQVKYIYEREYISNKFIQDKYENHLFDNHSYLFHKGNPYPVVANFYKDDLRNPIQIKNIDLKADTKLESLIFARRFQIEQQLKAYKDGIKLNTELLKALEKRTNKLND